MYVDTIRTYDNEHALCAVGAAASRLLLPGVGAAVCPQNTCQRRLLRLQLLLLLTVLLLPLRRVMRSTHIFFFLCAYMLVYMFVWFIMFTHVAHRFVCS